MIGINTAIQPNAGGGSIGIGFAVPVDIAKRIIPEILSKGYVSRPWLGISTFPLNARIARAFDLPVAEGIIIGEVYRSSGAAAAGLRPAAVRETIYGGISLQQLGDVIVSVGGRKVTNTDDLQNALQDKKPGETVDVEVLRQGGRVTVPVRLSERPVEER
jgi:S1-C subfamily serine protease